VKVLVVDDHAIFRRMVKGMLPAGVNAIEAGNGEEAVAACQANADIKLILTDHNMPRMTGLDMVAALRQKNLLPGVPIVIVTSERDATLVAKAKGLGVENWLVKPFKKDELTAMVTKLVG
jgi:two-component system chemotaxis response regulator CheY